MRRASEADSRPGMAAASKQAPTILQLKHEHSASGSLELKAATSLVADPGSRCEAQAVKIMPEAELANLSLLALQVMPCSGFLQTCVRQQMTLRALVACQSVVLVQ